MKVLLRTREPGQMEWHTRYEDFVRLPTVGEFVAERTATQWYRIGVVVHTPYSKETDAEIFAVRVNDRDELHKAFPTVSP